MPSILLSDNFLSFILCVSLYASLSIQPIYAQSTSTSCQDSTESFQAIKPGDRGWTKQKTCQWVTRKSTPWRCAFVAGAKEGCPLTCTNCCEEVSGSYNLTFNGKPKTCEWAKQNVEVRCRKPPTRQLCAITCGQCSSSSPIPTPSPTPSPTPGGPGSGGTFVTLENGCQNAMAINTVNGITSQSACETECMNNSECTAVGFSVAASTCELFRRCDAVEVDSSNASPSSSCPSSDASNAVVCTLKRKRSPNANPKYSLKACLADSVGASCTPVPVSNSDLRYISQTASSTCEETEGQRGSVTHVDLTLPPGKALYVEVTTLVPSQNAARGFFVRPTRITSQWSQANLLNDAKTQASFYLADAGQFSVEFASDATWRDQVQATTFDALMIFVNPELAPLPGTSTLIPISPDTNSVYEDLGPNRSYLFVAGIDYDWGKDHVFKVHDNTAVYFEKGAYVRARIVQTEKKVQNVLLQGYGTLDVRYDLEDDLIGVSDDATRQNVGIYGKNIRVNGLTLLNTNPTCGKFGYCLNINANWSPLADPNGVVPFDAFDLQLKDPPYAFRQAHCQENNMDDSPNTDFTNCPTSHANGQKVSYVKCMTWQLGQDGLNAGKWGTVEDSFVRTVDDAIKPWDSHGVYKRITIWQLTLGWPINFGWWNWNQPDVDTIIDSVYIIHNHNWVTSPNWPATQSGQCIIGGVYGSGAVKERYQLSNIFVETAASCAVGLQISKDAYSRHLTPEGCVGSLIDMKIDGIYFDEAFYQTGGYNNFLSGETEPNAGCGGNLSGMIENMYISGIVAGRPLSRSDFIVDGSTVPNLTFGSVTDPNVQRRTNYVKYSNKNAYDGSGGIEIDLVGAVVSSFEQCLDRCQSDWSCECVVHRPSDSKCYKRSKCVVREFDGGDGTHDIYVRQ